MKKRAFNHRHRQRLDRAADNYLSDCYQKRVPVRGKDFARSLSMTPEYTSFLGSNIVGGIHAYLRKKQLVYAARLLVTTPLTVEEIAIRTGFGSRVSLYRWFLAEYEVTPTAYRMLKK